MMVFYVARDWMSDGYRVLIGDRSVLDRNHVFQVASVTMSPVEPIGRPPEPTLNMSKAEAQAMMDAFWEAGLRPSSGEGNAGQLGATRAHLDDMRKLVFEAKS